MSFRNSNSNEKNKTTQFLLTVNRNLSEQKEARQQEMN